jgi:fluoride exporter
MWLPSDAVAIGIGAVCGACSRYHVGKVAAEWIASDPNRLGRYAGWHTAAINVGGSFILGGVAGMPLLPRPPPPQTPARPPSPSLMKSVGPSSLPPFGLTPRAKLMLGVGFCGSFTTFSTYSLDVVQWIAAGQSTKAATYVVTNNVAAIAAAASGLAVVKKLFGAAGR